MTTHPLFAPIVPMTRRNAVLENAMLALSLLAVRQYRKQMLQMDKHLIFEEPSPSAF